MDNKEFRRFEDLQVAEDGEIILVSGKHTYGHKTSDGHRTVWYKGKGYWVHRLVAECFLNGGEPIDGKVYAVHHINGNPEDNRVENLIILTHSDHRRLHNKGNQYMKGKHLTEETKRKMSEAKKGKVLNEDHKKPIIGVHKVSGEAMEFESATDAARVLNITRQNITACCKGRLKSTGGWRFEYKIA